MSFLLSVETHLEHFASTVEADVSAKAKQFWSWATNEEAKIADAIVLLKAKGLQVLKDGVTL